MFYGGAESQPMSQPEVKRARAVCDGCPVRSICLLDALDYGDGWGIWGGYTNPERRRALALLGDPASVIIAVDGGPVVIEGSAPIAVVHFEERELDSLVRLS